MKKQATIFRTDVAGFSYNVKIWHEINGNMVYAGFGRFCRDIAEALEYAKANADTALAAIFPRSYVFDAAVEDCKPLYVRAKLVAVTHLDGKYICDDYQQSYKVKHICSEAEYSENCTPEAM